MKNGLKIFLMLNVVLQCAHMSAQEYPSREAVMERMEQYVNENWHTVTEEEIHWHHARDENDKILSTNSETKAKILKDKFLDENPLDDIVYNYPEDLLENLSSNTVINPKYDLCQIGGFENLMGDDPLELRLSTWQSGECATARSDPRSTSWERMSLGTDEREFMHVWDGLDAYGLTRVFSGERALRLGSQKKGSSSVYGSCRQSHCNGINAFHGLVDVDLNSYMFTFMYAMVLQNPGHPDRDPHMYAVARDRWGRVIDKFCFSADCDDSILECNVGQTLGIRDWSCGELNLRRCAGERVLISFVAADCAYGAHFGFTYLDDICQADCSNDEQDEDCCEQISDPSSPLTPSEVIMDFDLELEEVPSWPRGYTHYYTNLIATASPMLSEACSYSWQVCRYDKASDNCDISNAAPVEVSNGDFRWSNSYNRFYGYGHASANLSQPGRFIRGAHYAITRTIDCPCMEPHSYTRFVQIPDDPEDSRIMEIKDPEYNWNGFDTPTGEASSRTSGEEFKIKEIDENACNWSVSPNPARYYTVITHHNADRDVEYRVVSMDGRVAMVLKDDDADGEVPLPMSDLVSGVYFVQVVRGEEVLCVRRVVKF